MSTTNNSTEVTLQICFGVFGILGTITTLASLHHQDSLGCILFRRLIRPRIISDDDDDLEAAVGALEDIETSVEADITYERRPTLPPSYEQSSPDSRSDTFDRSQLDTSVVNSSITAMQTQPKSD